jgi:hypothetical protein
MSILHPVFALVALTALTLGRLAVGRLRAVQSGEASLAYFKTYQDGREPDHTRALARHYDNLFQAPMLFYVAALVILVTGTETVATLALAWAYVGLRAVHTWIHTGPNDVVWRFRVFGLSWVVLVAMWGMIAFRTLG